MFIIFLGVKWGECWLKPLDRNGVYGGGAEWRQDLCHPCQDSGPYDLVLHMLLCSKHGTILATSDSFSFIHSPRAV